MTIPLGVYAYIGAPQTGKTYLADKEQHACAAAHGLVPLTLDLRRATNFKPMPHAASVREVCETVWQNRRPCYFTPANRREYNQVLAACQAAGHVAVLIDEIAALPWSEQLATLTRAWSHAGPVNASRENAVFVTAHHITGDLGQKFLAASPHCRVFRLSAPASVKFFLAYKRIDWDGIEKLPDRHHIDVDL